MNNSLKNTAEPSIAALILAAGKGTRMKGGLPKVLNTVGNLSLVGHVIRNLQEAGVHQIQGVLPPESPVLEKAFQEHSFVIQQESLGTGHAVLCTTLPDDVPLFVSCGDQPLGRSSSFKKLIEAFRDQNADIALLAAPVERPHTYGRLEIQGDQVTKIIEASQDNRSEPRVDWVNTGWMILSSRARSLLKELPLNPHKKEYFLTDLIALMHQKGGHTLYVPISFEEGQGCNTLEELSELETTFQKRMRAEAVARGVRMQSPETVFFSFDTQLEEGVVVEPYVMFGPGVSANSGARIRSFSHLEGAHLASKAEAGPFARLRPGTILEGGSRVGNFVEVKETHLLPGAKASHLTYLGDAEIGAHANIGAGTITCNYDGVKKSKTLIGAGAFIGSNSSLVAPVSIGENSLVGAGSVITRDIPVSTLALTRAPLTTVSRKKKPLK